MTSSLEELIAQKVPDQFLVRRELRKLPSVLAPGERVVTLGRGAYAARNGLVVVTDRRVFFLDEGLVRSRLEDFPLDKISSVETRTGLMWGRVTLFASGNRAELADIAPKERAVEIGEAIRARINGGGGSRTASPAPEAPEERLRRLEALRKEGLLTDAEYDEKRRELVKAL